jgi:hypothetical protein
MILTSNTETTNSIAAWASGALELARWSMARLVNRTDVYGGYRPLHLRESGPVGNIWTKPAVKDRGKKLLTPEILARHYAGRDVGDLIGLHSTSPQNTSRWGALDIDWHGTTSADPQLNWESARHWFGKLRTLGFHPLLEDSNWSGGYHLWTLFRDAVPTAHVFAFLRWLTRDHAVIGLPVRPETFPKQARVEPGRYGNWLRLFGRHHTRNHWSRFWDGHKWLPRQRAVDHLLATEGDSPSLIPAEAMPAEKPYRYEPRRGGAIADGPWLSRRISAYLARLPSNLGVGEHRHDVAYRLAAYLVRDLRLSDEAALHSLRQWDCGNRSPLGEGELTKQIDCAHKYGKHGYGSGCGGPPATSRPTIHFEVRT